MVSFRRRQLRARNAAGRAAPVTIAIEAGLPRQAVHSQAPRGVRPESATGKNFLKKTFLSEQNGVSERSKLTPF